MTVQDVIPLGKVASLTLAEAGGVGTASLTASSKLGGGSVAGFGSFAATIEFELSAAELADAGLLALAKKYPQFATEITAFKALMDAYLAKA